MLECLDRLSTSEHLTPQQQSDLESMRDICDDLVGSYEEVIKLVNKLNNASDQSSHLKLSNQLLNDNEISILSALIFSRFQQAIDIEELLDTVAYEVSQLLQVDQVIVYPSISKISGKISGKFSTSESVIEHEVVQDAVYSLRNQPLPSFYTQPNWIKQYQTNISIAINDTSTILETFDIDALQFFQSQGIRSVLILPIPKGREGQGLILVHQYHISRQWQDWEIEFLEKLVTQLAILMHQMQLLEKSETIKRERDSVMAKLQHSQTHDALTGLLNRDSFMAALDLTFARARELEVPTDAWAVIFLDCDRFKSINDNFGIAIGDQLLQAIGQRLLSFQKEGITIARIDSDEFAFLCEQSEQIHDLTSFANQIIDSIKQPFDFEQTQVFTSISIGIAIYNQNYTYPNEIIRDATLAMKQARKGGRGKSAIFHRNMYQDAKFDVQLENDLRHALANGELYLVYQPIISIHQHKLTGFEVLLRWLHPVQGIISPQEFLPIAEETGEIINIGYWILETACQQLQEWQQIAPTSPITLSINISTVQVIQPDFVERFQAIMAAKQIEPCAIKLEVTESVFMQDIETAAQKLDQLRKTGIQVCIDDFGTGYSSFSYLQNLPINILKIDRSFTNKIMSDVKSKRIIQAILRLANNLGMGIVVEGVETQDELSYFEDLGGSSIDIQGYLISHPLSNTKATEWFRNSI
jgi:diguanylate cyclase (GGDEF)-like protein